MKISITNRSYSIYPAYQAGNSTSNAPGQHTANSGGRKTLPRNPNLFSDMLAANLAG